MRLVKMTDAVLFSAVGDPKFDNDPTAKVRPEQGLLAMRKKLGLFANIRPVQTFNVCSIVSPSCGAGGWCRFPLHPRTDRWHVLR